MTIEELKYLKESEDQVEFKEAKHNFPFAGGSHNEQKERRKCFLGYLIALCNEGGGRLVLGMSDKIPRKVVGTDFGRGKVGALTDETYSRLGIRVRMEELFEGEFRVLVITVPERPVGKLMKFEGVPLMRVGDSLRNMSDAEMRQILFESEPDYSERICPGLSLDDLDPNAILILQDRYAKRQDNPDFCKLPAEQALSDLKLSRDGHFTYAALILLGLQKTIRKKLPQAKTVLEYRNQLNKTEYDWREEIEDPLFIGIDRIWKLIHSRNSKIFVREGPYVTDVLAFNEKVVREAVLNAVTHRDYRLTSETVIKQYPGKIQINNPGGFPLGVNLENIITVSSTPRSRLLASILEKTGLVERSGQGVDKMFGISLAEGKSEPDYSGSDDFQVSLDLKSEVIDPAFYLFINAEQENRSKEDKLGNIEIITLAKIRDGYFSGLMKDVVQKLGMENLIQRVGSGSSNRFTLGSSYQEFREASDKVGNYLISEVVTVVDLLDRRPEVKMGVIVDAFEGKLNRDQVRYLVDKLLEDKILIKTGKGAGTSYRMSKKLTRSRNKWKLITKALRVVPLEEKSSD